MRDLNILIAYPYFTKDLEDRLLEANEEIGGRLNVLIDSGAFTAYNAGDEIKLKDYTDFLDKLRIKPFRYFALDKIGDEVKTMENVQAMYKQGYKPIPVFTHGQNINDIDTYYELSDYISYGGLVGKPASIIASGINKVMSVTGKRKLHLLGYTSMPYIKKFKPYSCDSSSWLSGLRYASVPLYEGNGVMKIYDKQKLRTKNNRFMDRVRYYGFEPNTGMLNHHWSGGQSLMGEVSAASWVHMSQDCEKNLGTKLFLALATKNAFDLLMKGYRRVNYV